MVEDDVPVNQDNLSSFSSFPVHDLVSNISCINQLDGADTSSETSDSNTSQYDGDEEAYSAPVRAVLVPAPPQPGMPPSLVVDSSGWRGPPPVFL